MVNPNRKSNIWNNLSSSAIPLLITYLLFFVIILSVEYVLNQNNKSKQLETIKLWIDGNVDNPKYKSLFEEPIGNIHKKMESIHAHINRERSSTEENKKLINPSGVFNINWIFKTGNNQLNLNYQGGTLLLSENRKDLLEEEKAKPEAINNIEELEKKVFANFLGKIKTDIYNPKLERISKETEIDGETHFKKYSDTILEYFINSDTSYDYRKQLPRLRASYIYIVNEIGAMIQYPAQDELIEFPPFTERPWWQASEGKYISHFNGSNGENKWGITGSYVDIDTEYRGLTLVKTVWYKFTDQKSQKKYVLCLDLFFDSDKQVPLKSNLNVPYLPFEINLPFTKNILLDSLLIGSILTLLFGVIYEFKLKEIIHQWITVLKDYSQDSLTIKLQREKNRYFADKSDNNLINVQTSYSMENQEENEQSSEAGWHISKIITAGQSIRVGSINRSVSNIIVTSNKEYDLSIKNDNCPRCIEIWKVTIEPEKKEIGTFVAEWDNTMNPDITKQLDIKSIHWEKKYEYCRDNIKKELLSNLLGNEYEEYLTVIGRKLPEFQDNVPEFFKKIDRVKETIDRGKYLRQRKFIFPEITIINELHKLGQLKAICNQNFLELLKDYGGETLTKFLEQKEKDEIFWLEKTEEDLQSSYKEFDANIQGILKISSLKPMIYPQNIKNKNFCIVQVNNEPHLVADISTDNAYQNPGSFSCSWREVDIKFYRELFEMLKENGTVLDWSSFG